MKAKPSRKGYFDGETLIDSTAQRSVGQRAEDAEEFSDEGFIVQLEDMVRDESGHSEETERILRDWPL